jgi:uncharacterized membrane-anchored protein
MRAHRRVTAALVIFFCGGIAVAQGEKTAPAPDIEWKKGPALCDLGSVAQISLSEGYVFTGAKGTKTLMELMHNPVSGQELGTIMPIRSKEDGSWFVVFEFASVGFVTDTDRDKLDADGLLKSIREGTENANKIRKERHWATMSITGWNTPPFYDTKTNNLTWAIDGVSTLSESPNKATESVVNYSTRLLGRNGVMTIDLVLDPGSLPRVLPKYRELVATVSYKPGNRYAEFKQGDKLAGYGLTALVAGGAGAIAAKTGLLAKFWKLIVGAVIALGALLKKVWAKLTGRDDATSNTMRPS